MGVQFLVGDTRDLVATIPDGSVSLIATSPPFMQLRSYLPSDHADKHREIGSEPDPATFIDTLLALTAEWGRVLAPWGSIAIELGDTYAGSGGGGGDYLPGGLREGQPGFGGSTEAQRAGNAAHWRAKNGNPGAWPRPKCMAMIPELYRVALAYGINPLTGAPSPAGRWLVRNLVVWARPNPAVGALGDKVRPSTSYIVIATRSPKRWFDLTAVRHSHARDYTNEKPGGLTEFNRNGSVEFNRTIVANPAGAPPLDCWADEYDGTHDTWTLTTQPSSLAHYAMWPARLAERLVLMMCPAQVCRQCGEARRRVERNVRVTDGLVRRPNQLARERHGEDFASHGHTDRETVGWTDCGCVCPSCEGTGAGGIGDRCWECEDGRAWRPGLVLDPFVGSGTTCAVADLHDRDAIGVDLDPRNFDIYPRRYDEVRRALFGVRPDTSGQLGLFKETSP